MTSLGVKATWMWPALMGAGGVELTIEPSGQCKRDRREAALRCRAGRGEQPGGLHEELLLMMYGLELKKWGACGEAPVKSKMQLVAGDGERARDR